MRHLLVLALLIFASISGSAHATVLQFSFTGAITFVDADLVSAGAPTVGATVSGFFQYDTTTSPGHLTSGEAVYPMPSLPYSLSFGPLQLGGVGELGVQNVGLSVSNDDPVEDHFTFGAFTGPGEATVAGSGVSIGSYSLTQLGIALTDTTGAAFNSLALPTTLTLSEFDDRLVRVFYFDASAGAHRHFDADISALSLAPATAVPEASTLSIFFFGLASLGLVRRRRLEVR